MDNAPADLHALPRLDRMPGPWRVLLTAFLITMTAGYLTGLYFVAFTTQGSPQGVAEQFRGNEGAPAEEVAEIKYEKSLVEMLSIIHTHVTSFALIFLSIGGIFLLGRARPRTKAVLAAEPFVATLVLFGGMAALRWLGPAWAKPMAFVMMAAGFSTFVCLIAMVGASLWEMWRPHAHRRKPAHPSRG